MFYLDDESGKIEHPLFSMFTICHHLEVSRIIVSKENILYFCLGV
jgi:hypothetical protein